MIHNIERDDEPESFQLDAYDRQELKEIFRDHAEGCGKWPDDDTQERIIEEYIFDQMYERSGGYDTDRHLSNQEWFRRYEATMPEGIRQRFEMMESMESDIVAEEERHEKELADLKALHADTCHEYEESIAALQSELNRLYDEIDMLEASHNDL